MIDTAEPRTRRLRRVITGRDVDGASVVALDGPPTPVLEFVPEAGLYEIWTHAPGENSAAKHPPRLSPPEGGAKFRWFTVLPESPATPPGALAAFYDEAFAAMEPQDVRPDTARHPGMHTTQTIDFVVVIEGRVRLILDAGETVLGPGDVVVQRGTNHAWVCEGDAPALLACVLVDQS